MFPKILDLSGHSNSVAIELDSYDLDNDDLRAEDIATSEKAEFEIWQGIKAEKKGNLRQAISHYRASTKLAPLSAKGYQLLANALKKNRQQLKQNDFSNTVEVIEGQVTLIAANNPQINQLSILPLNITHKPQDSVLKIPNTNFIPTQVNTRKMPATKSESNSIVLLPSVDVAPSGELVLQADLNVAQVYLQQAMAFFEQKEWSKSIKACQDALNIYPNLGEAYKIWGNSLQQSGNSAEAIGIYALGLKVQPDMAEIYCNLGSIYAKSKKWQQAIAHYQKSLIIDPQNDTPLRNLAKVWDELGEVEKSSECYIKALEINPKLLDAQNQFNLANNLIEEGKLDSAIAIYKNCIQLDPKLLNAYVRLSEALEQKGEIEEAQYYYKKLAQLQIADNSSITLSKTQQQIRSFLYQNAPALQPSPTSDAAQMQMELGNRYFRGKQWQNAINCYLQAIKINPQQPEFYINLGQAFEKIGEASKASQVYYRGFSLKPQAISAKNHYLLGNQLEQQQQLKPAITCYRRAISQQPDFLDAYWQLGIILMEMGNLQDAIACYRQALKVNPAIANSYLLLGKVFFLQKQWLAAQTCYQKACQIEPKNVEVLHNLGEVFNEQQQWQKAIACFRQVLDLDPNYTWSHYHLATALMELQQWQPAKEALEAFIKLKPDFYWSYSKLGDVCLKTSDSAQAVAAYRQALKLDPDAPEISEKINALLDTKSTSQLPPQSEKESLYFRTLEVMPNNPEMYIQLANFYQQKGEVEQALAFYKIALQIQPNNLIVVDALAKLKTQLGRS